MIRDAAIRLLLPLMGLLLSAPLASGGNLDAVCATAAQQPAVRAARSDLDRDPGALATRLHLSDLLINASCFDEAIQVLEAGQAANPRSSDLEYRLTRARGMQRQREYFKGLDQAAVSTQPVTSPAPPHIAAKSESIAEKIGEPAPHHASYSNLQPASRAN
jgi:predicted Zn-dependent protease